MIRDRATMAIVYVGQTILPLAKRLGGHVSEARHPYGKYGLRAWLRSQDFKAVIEPLMTGIPEHKLGRYESIAIAAYGAAGVKLLNRAHRTRGQ